MPDQCKLANTIVYTCRRRGVHQALRFLTVPEKAVLIAAGACSRMLALTTMEITPKKIIKKWGPRQKIGGVGTSTANCLFRGRHP